MPRPKGFRVSEETRRKMSLVRIGKKHPRQFNAEQTKALSERTIKMNKERVWTKEQRERVAKKMRGNIPWNKGTKGLYTMSEKNKQVLRDKGYDYFKRMSILGIEKQQSFKEPTSIEKQLYDLLTEKEIDFVRQKKINDKFLVDAYLPDLNLVIECDGDYWHGLEGVKKRDKSKNAYLIKCGYELLRVSEAQINTGVLREIIF